MFYEMQISVGVDNKTKLVSIAPARIETLTDDIARVTNEEIKIVTQAFAGQIEQHVRILLKKE